MICVGLTAEKQTMSNLMETKIRDVETVTKKLENCEKEKEELGIEIGKQKRKVDGLQALLRASELKSEKLNRFLDRFVIALHSKVRSVNLTIRIS